MANTNDEPEMFTLELTRAEVFLVRLALGDRMFRIIEKYRRKEISHETYDKDCRATGDLSVEIYDQTGVQFLDPKDEKHG